MLSVADGGAVREHPVAIGGQLPVSSPASFSAHEWSLLNKTYFFDRFVNYVEQNPLERWFVSWMTEHRSLRGLASLEMEFDPDGGGAGGSSSYENWRRLQEQRRSVGQLPSSHVPSTSRVIERDRLPLEATEGYEYHGEYVVQCPPDTQKGDPCLIIGSAEDYEILDLVPDNSHCGPIFRAPAFFSMLL